MAARRAVFIGRGASCVSTCGLVTLDRPSEARGLAGRSRASGLMREWAGFFAGATLPPPAALSRALSPFRFSLAFSFAVWGHPSALPLALHKSAGDDGIAHGNIHWVFFNWRDRPSWMLPASNLLEHFDAPMQSWFMFLKIKIYKRHRAEGVTSTN